MYEAHWKLNARPFEPGFRANYYYPSELHQTALLKLRYATENRRALAVLGGISGTGKNFVIHQLSKQLPDFVGPVVSIAYPAMNPDDFLRSVAKKFSSDRTSFPTTAEAVDAIEQALAKNVVDGRHALLLIDEAECLEQQGILDTLRYLLNLAADHAPSESALTIALSGHPALIGQLERYPALDQRVAVRCLLQNFTFEETNAYIGHRLRQAGGRIEAIFQTDALEAIHHFSDGIPRRINAVCDLALMVGYAQDQTTIRSSLIESVQRELAPAAA
jgi:general secretion pathway protein A